MPAKGKVSLTIQTVFCAIPILDMYAAYRIKKLRKYLALVIFVIAIPVSITSAIFLPVEDEGLEGFRNVMTFYYGIDGDQFIYSVGVQIGTILFAMFLIRRWSNRWNTQFDTSVSIVE